MLLGFPIIYLLFWDAIPEKKCPKCKNDFDYSHTFRGPSPNEFYMCTGCNKRYYFCYSDNRLKSASSKRYDHYFNMH